MTVPLTIVGSGMAGLGLVRQLRALKDDRPITVITADSGDDYSKPLLSTGFAKGLPPERLAMQSALGVAEHLNVALRSHTRVDAIDLQARTLHIGAERLPWSELVLATGASPAMPFRVPPALGDRVFQVNDLDDYRAFHGALEALNRPARVVIVGFGLVGCEFANDLAAGGHRVALVAPEAAPLPRLLPEPLGRALGEAFGEAGVSLHTRCSVAGFSRQGADVGVALDDGSQLDADLVLVATGLRPRTALAEAAGLPTGSAGIHVDRMLNAAPGVHALGDVACVDGVNAMYVQPLQASAKALARTLTGTPTEVGFGAWPVMVKTPLLPVVALPPAVAPARWRLDGEGKDWVALAEDKDERLIGFALTGRCVRRKVELARAAPALLG